VVRAAVERDVGRVLEIEDASFVDPWSAEAFLAALTLPHMHFLVVEWPREQRIAGSTGAATLAGYVLAMALGIEGEIADIAVAPEARGQGMGGALLDNATARLMETGVRTLYLEVRESNSAARGLYHSRGFAPVGRRQGYYRDPLEDALVLRRDLAPT
jgi:ribosomal-protein-alanine N-acetyltransferase